VKARIAAVEYLNAKPLTWGLERLPRGQFAAATPSAVAELLSRGQADVALIPSIELLRDPACEYLPGICIASHGPVMSVVLVCNKPPERVRTVALDTSSRSSVALCRIILQRLYGAAPDYVDWTPGTNLGSVRADAFLAIGDHGLRLRLCNRDALDMGEAWHNLTGLPFVYALWAGKHIDDEVAELLRRSKREGTAHLGEIAAREAARLDLPGNVCRDYLVNRIGYDLGEAEQEGLDRFRQYAAEIGLCPAHPATAAAAP